MLRISLVLLLCSVLLACAGGVYQPAYFDSRSVQGQVPAQADNIRALPLRFELDGQLSKSLVLGLPELDAFFWPDADSVVLVLKRRDTLGWLKTELIGGEGPDPVVIVVKPGQAGRVLNPENEAEEQARILNAMAEVEWREDWGALAKNMGLSVAQDWLKASLFGSSDGAECGTTKRQAAAQVQDRRKRHAALVLRKESIHKTKMDGGGCVESGRDAECFLGPDLLPVQCPDQSALVSNDGQWYFDGKGVYSMEGWPYSRALAEQPYEAPITAGRPATPFLLGLAPSPDFQRLALVYYDKESIYLDFAELTIGIAGQNESP